MRSLSFHFPALCPRLALWIFSTSFLFVTYVVTWTSVRYSFTFRWILLYDTFPAAYQAWPITMTPRDIHCVSPAFFCFCTVAEHLCDALLSFRQHDEYLAMTSQESGVRFSGQGVGRIEVSQMIEGTKRVHIAHWVSNTDPQISVNATIAPLWVQLRILVCTSLVL